MRSFSRSHFMSGLWAEYQRTHTHSCMVHPTIYIDSSTDCAAVAAVAATTNWYRLNYFRRVLISKLMFYFRYALCAAHQRRTKRIDICKIPLISLWLSEINQNDWVKLAPWDSKTEEMKTFCLSYLSAFTLFASWMYAAGILRSTSMACNWRKLSRAFIFSIDLMRGTRSIDRSTSELGDGVAEPDDWTSLAGAASVVSSSMAAAVPSSASANWRKRKKN